MTLSQKDAVNQYFVHTEADMVKTEFLWQSAKHSVAEKDQLIEEQKKQIGDLTTTNRLLTEHNNVLKDQNDEKNACLFAVVQCFEEETVGMHRIFKFLTNYTCNIRPYNMSAFTTRKEKIKQIMKSSQAAENSKETNDSDGA
jgi:hypothetical protein